MFAIYPDEKNKERIHFHSVQEASEKTGIPSEDIDKALKQVGHGRYFSPKDKKVFWIKNMDVGGQFVRIGKEYFSDVNSIMVRFGLSRDDVIDQLCSEKGCFYPPGARFEEIQLYSPLRRLIDARTQAKLLEQTLSLLPPSKAHEKARSLIEEIEKLF